MTKKEIKKAAEDYTDKFGFICDVGDVFTAFEDGAKWALSNMWHSVHDGDWPKCGYAEDVRFVVMFKDGNISLAYYDEDANGICDFYDDCDCPLDVKYWMEIPEIKMEIKKI